MEMIYDYVEYNDQIYRIHDLAKKLGLCMSTYRTYRLKGISPQEAFEKCLCNLPIKVFFNGELCEVQKLIKNLDLGLRTYQRKVKAGFSPQEAFDYVLEQKKVKDEQAISKLEEMELQKSETEQEKKYQEYVRRGLPKKYTSLSAFCFCNNYDYRRVSYLLERYPEETLQNIIENLYVGSGEYKGNLKYTVYGVSFKALCLKYGYLYDTCLEYFKQTNDVYLSFMYFDMIRLGIPFGIRKNVRKLIPYLPDMSEDQIGFNLKYFDIPLEYLELILRLREIALSLQKELFYYELNYMLEFQWEEYCMDDLSRLDNTDLKEYHAQRAMIKNKFRKEVLKMLQYEKKEENELSSRFADLTLVDYPEQVVWCKKRKNVI